MAELFYQTLHFFNFPGGVGSQHAMVTATAHSFIIDGFGSGGQDNRKYEDYVYGNRQYRSAW